MLRGNARKLGSFKNKKNSAGAVSRQISCTIFGKVGFKNGEICVRRSGMRLPPRNESRNLLIGKERFNGGSNTTEREESCVPAAKIQS